MELKLIVQLVHVCNADAGINILQDILMNSRYIANLHDPAKRQDAATHKM